MNIFEETYRKEQEMVRQFDATDDEEERETIREAHERLMEWCGIKKVDSLFSRIS